MNQYVFSKMYIFVSLLYLFQRVYGLIVTCRLEQPLHKVKMKTTNLPALFPVHLIGRICGWPRSCTGFVAKPVGVYS